MSTHSKLLPILFSFLFCLRAASPAEISPAPAADQQSIRQAFVAAMQRIRQNLPEVPDSAELEAYPIHDYLAAARFRRDLVKKPDDALDTAIDAFLLSHAGQPVTRALKHDWLVNLAQQRQWDRF